MKGSINEELVLTCQIYYLSSTVHQGKRSATLHRRNCRNNAKIESWLHEDTGLPIAQTWDDFCQLNHARDWVRRRQTMYPMRQSTEPTKPYIMAEVPVLKGYRNQALPIFM